MATGESKKEESAQIVTDGATEEWDEARLMGALERLQEMHIQLRRLRDAIPSIVRPIHNASCSSPERLYADFRSAAVGAVSNVRQFRDLIRDPASKEVFAKAKASRDANQLGLEGWLVEQHENWLDETALRSAGLIKTEEDLLGELALGEAKEVKVEEKKKVEDVDAIVKAFGERHPDVDIKYLDSISNILVFLPPPKLHFTISWNPNATTNRVYEVTTKGTTKLHTSTNQGLARRTHKDSLHWTLELISDYMNVKQQRCYTCNKLLDAESRFATLKITKSTTEANGEGIPWDSFHLDCSAGPEH